jgi:hypothetical protein
MEQPLTVYAHSLPRHPISEVIDCKVVTTAFWLFPPTEVFACGRQCSNVRSWGLIPKARDAAPVEAVEVWRVAYKARVARIGSHKPTDGLRVPDADLWPVPKTSRLC